MPTEREHRNRAQQNFAFAKSFDLRTTPYIDWVVTAYFYAALHWVDAVLAKRENFHPDIHEVRREAVKNRSYLRAVKDEYRQLQERSEDARYRLITFTTTKVEQKVIPLYTAIESHIRPQLDESEQ